MLLDLIATCTFGLEAVVKRELATLGYEATSPSTGRVEFQGDLSAVARCNLWLRCADRVLIRIARFHTKDFEALFEGVKALPWEQWIPADAAFPVSGRSVKSQLSSVPAVQRSVKKAIVERLMAAHHVRQLPESGATVAVEVALLDDVATFTIDTTGAGLHKRGYRDLTGAAPLRETLAAALVHLSFWNRDRAMLDPFCGSGTLCIEAAMIGRNIAPGAQRRFAAEDWHWLKTNKADAWHRAREEARDLIEPDLPERIVGTDIDEQALSLARRHAERAGVQDSIHWQRKPFDELASKRTHGCLITNPPYGHRIFEQREVQELYRSMPIILRKLPTWSFFMLTSWPDFEGLLGRKADRRRKLFNAQIECTYYQFHGPKQGEQVNTTFFKQGNFTAPVLSQEQASSSSNAAAQQVAAPVFGGLQLKASEQAEVFANRLRKMDRHRRRWPTRRGITCYRVYNREVPEIPLMVDRYEDCLYIAEYFRPHDRDVAQQADWLDLMVRTAGKSLDVPRQNIFVKHRRRQRGDTQYEKLSDKGFTLIANEGGLRFEVNLSDYLDTGLFLDHRITRDMVRKEAAGKHVLNLFAYTGAFSVYAVAGGATRVTTVDLSNTYLEWAKRNFVLNNLPADKHAFIRADATQVIRDKVAQTPGDPTYDLAIVDPPTYSNSRSTDEDWDVQLHHAALLQAVAGRMNRDGVIYFSTNFHRFRFDQEAMADFDCREITRQTVPEDFANKKSHRCWRLTVQ